MALKVGDLYVSLTANTQKLQGQLNGAAKQIEKFGRDLKGLGKDASEMSNMVVAAMGAAFAVASSKDAAVKKQVDELKNQSTALAVEVARVALPVLQSMADFIGRIVALFRAMTPEQRAMVLTFFEAAAAVSAVGMAAVKLEPAFKLAASGVRLLGTVMGAVSLPALAAIGAIILLVGFLREAWDQNLGGIQDKAAVVWSWIQDKWMTVANALSGASETVKVSFAEAFKWIGEKFSDMAVYVIRGSANLARALNLDSVFDVDGMERAALDFTSNLPKMLIEGAAALKDGAASVVGGVGTAVKMTGAGVVKIASDVKAKIESALRGLLPESAKAGPMKDLADAGAKAQADYGRLRADKLDASFVALRGRGGNLRDSLEMAGALNVPKELEQFNGEALSSIKGIEDVRDFLHQLGGKAGETERYLAAWERWNEEQRKNAAHVDRLREDRAPQAAQQFLAGGSFGDAARMAGVTTALPDFLEKLNGSSLKSLSAFEDIEDQLAQVRDLSPVAKELWERSKKNYLEGIEAEKEKAKLQKQQYEQAVSGFVDGVVGSMGKLGGVLQAATGPLAQAGGPIGALVAVGFELLKNSKQFGEFQAALDGVIQGLSDALGQLLPPFTMLVRAIQPIVAAVGAIVANVVPLLTAVLEPLLPVFVILGALLMALSPIVNIVVEVLRVQLIPVFWLLEQVMRSLFGALQTVAVIILGVVVGVVNLWNGVVSAVQSVLMWISGFEIAGQKPFAFLADWATSLEAAKGPAAQYQKQLNDTMAMTYESAMTTAKSFNDAAGAADQLAAGMTNAASGFKVDLARFNATSTGPGSPADFGSSSSALAGDTYVTIVSNDPEQIWDRMESVRRSRNFQRGRGPLGGLPAFGS